MPVRKQVTGRDILLGSFKLKAYHLPNVWAKQTFILFWKQILLRAYTALEVYCKLQTFPSLEQTQLILSQCVLVKIKSARGSKGMWLRMAGFKIRENINFHLPVPTSAFSYLFYMHNFYPLHHSLYSPISISRIVWTGLTFLFTYMCTQYLHHIHLHPLHTSSTLPLIPIP
jgi:hypothetical protein